jgi:hypothetical protein
LSRSIITRYNNKSHSVLLSQDWLNKTQAVLWPLKNEIYFTKNNSQSIKESDIDFESDESDPDSLLAFDHFNQDKDLKEEDVFTQPECAFEKERKEVVFEEVCLIFHFIQAFDSVFCNIFNVSIEHSRNKKENELLENFTSARKT